MNRTIWIAIPLCALGLGCLSAVGPVPPGVSEKRYALMQAYLEDTTSCARESLRYESPGQGRHVFDACGAPIELWYSASYGIRPAATNRFSRETKCDLRASQEEEIDFKTHVVEGCGRRVTYVYLCNGYGAQCSWIANTEQQQR